MPVTPRQRYNRLWNKVDRFYGQEGTKAPRFRPIGKGKGYAFVSGKREVSASPNYRRQLVAPKERAQKEARFATLHEWSHIFEGTGEGGANRKANVISHYLNKRQRSR